MIEKENLFNFGLEKGDLKLIKITEELGDFCGDLKLIKNLGDLRGNGRCMIPLKRIMTKKETYNDIKCKEQFNQIIVINLIDQNLVLLCQSYIKYIACSYTF